MTKEMLVQQLDKETLASLEDKLEINYGLFEIYRANYNANRLYRIVCFEKKTNQKVYLYINKDTVLVLTDKQGKKHRLYFDTVHVEGNLVTGLYSRIVGQQKSYNLDDIEKVEIHAELSATEKIE